MSSIKIIAMKSKINFIKTKFAIIAVLIVASLNLNAQKDTTEIQIGNLKVMVIEEAQEDSAKSDVKTAFKKVNKEISLCKETKEYNGQWAGIELGVNNFTNKDFASPSSSELSYMQLNPEKSIALSINFIEYNLNIIKSGRVGLTTGMGLQWNFFNLSQNVELYQDQQGVTQAKLIDTKIKKFKRNNLNMAYLTIPAIIGFKIPTNKKDISFGVGVTGSMRLWSKHKQKYIEDGEKHKYKLRDDFGLTPFRYGVTARVGYGSIGIFVDYQLTPLFKKDKGPELYPISIGLRLFNF